MFYADDVNILGRIVHTVKEKTEDLAVASTEIGLEVNADKTNCMVMPWDQIAVRNRSIKIENKSFERME